VRLLAATLLLVLVSPAVQAAGKIDSPIDITTVDLSPAYPCNPAKDLDKPYPPEIQEVDALLTDKPDGAPKDNAGNVVWKREVGLCEGLVDLNETLRCPHQVAVYARVRLDADGPGKIRLVVGHRGGLKAIVNGATIFPEKAESSERNALAFRTARQSAPLQ